MTNSTAQEARRPAEVDSALTSPGTPIRLVEAFDHPSWNPFL